MCALLSKTEGLGLKATQVVKADMSLNNSDFLSSLRPLSQR